MAKYSVDTFYTCTLKVTHFLDNISEKELENLEKREDGKFEILDIKIDKRKTKNLEKNSNSTINTLSSVDVEKNNIDKEKKGVLNKKFSNNIEESVSDWISTITSKSPNAIASGLKSFENIYVNKKIIGKLNDELQKLKESDDFIEGIKSLREKRKPTWKKP